VVFYTNTADLLRAELPRKRVKPALVYFSTACEPFMPYKPILDSLYKVMELLLDHGVYLLISTKSRIPGEFLQLFAGHPGRVHVQVGLTTICDDVRRLLEPKAAAVEERIAMLRDLISHGVRTEVRIDPLIPELTDTEESFGSLCTEISRSGAKQAVASYLFLRRANYGGLAVRYRDWSFLEMLKRLYTHKIEDYCGGTSIRIPASTYRQNKYERLKAIAGDHGLTLSLCGCKNPDLTFDCCHPALPTSTHQPEQEELFSSE